MRVIVGKRNIEVLNVQIINGPEGLSESELRFILKTAEGEVFIGMMKITSFARLKQGCYGQYEFDGIFQSHRVHGTYDVVTYKGSFSRDY